MSAERSRHAVVTGGTGALGRGVVVELLERGWRVTVPWYDEGEIPLLEEALGGRGGRPDGLALREADVTDPEAVEVLFDDGPVDALCNLVGGFAMGAAEDTDPETWSRMLRLNATSAFVSSRAAIGALRESGGGSIVNVAAFPALERGAAGMAAYAASKSAVVSLTRALAEERRETGVTVNAIAPEIIDTPANREAMPDADRSTWLEPAEIARVVAFLLGEDARIVTGSVLTLARG